MPFKIYGEFRRALRNDNIIDTKEVKKIIEKAKDDNEVTKIEKWVLNYLYEHFQSKFTPEAKEILADFLGIENEYEETGIPKPNEATTAERMNVPKTADEVEDLSYLASTFKREFNGMRRELARLPQNEAEKKVFDLFEKYGKRLLELSKDSDPQKIETTRKDLLKAYIDTGYSGLGMQDIDGDKLKNVQEVLLGTNIKEVDTDKDGLGDGYEVKLGSDPTKAETELKADHKPWTTTYWPMAGHGDVDGDPSRNLWAKGGPLDKLDELKRKRGDIEGAKALEYERKPALSWLVGDKDKGHYIPYSTIKESDAEVTTGVDFDGDGVITKGVKADFLDARGEFAPVSSRNEFVPKLGDEVLTKKIVTNENGKKVVKYFHQDGRELTPEELKNVVLTNPRSDGKATGTMDVGWWGSCDKVALAGILFKEPKHSVTIEGVTFTPQDIKGLLTVLADSQATGTDFVGNRYDERPDILVTKDGKQYLGKLLNDDVEFRTKEMWRWNGDYMVLDKVDKEIKFKTIDGKIITVKPEEVKHLAREDRRDISPMEFHTTIIKWLGVDKKPAAMDRDSSAHVWNYNYHKAKITSMKELTGSERPTKPGYNGPAGDGKIIRYDMDLYFGNTDYNTKHFSYWIEYNKAGEPVNGGWFSDNPDFLWRPSGFKNWTGVNRRNPYVTPELVKEIYEKSIE